MTPLGLVFFCVALAHYGYVKTGVALFVAGSVALHLKMTDVELTKSLEYDREDFVDRRRRERLTAPRQ